MEKPTRVQILEEGINLTTGDRNNTYGSPYPNLKTFAALVDAYLRGLGWSGPSLGAADGCVIMNQAKVSRIAVNKNHRDNWVDGSTYMAIGGECAEIETLKKDPNIEMPIGPEPHFVPFTPLTEEEKAGFDHTPGAINIVSNKRRPNDKYWRCLLCGKRRTDNWPSLVYDWGKVCRDCHHPWECDNCHETITNEQPIIELTMSGEGIPKREEKWCEACFRPIAQIRPIAEVD